VLALSARTTRNHFKHNYRFEGKRTVKPCLLFGFLLYTNLACFQLCAQPVSFSFEEALKNAVPESERSLFEWAITKQGMQLTSGSFGVKDLSTWILRMHGLDVDNFSTVGIEMISLDPDFKSIEHSVERIPIKGPLDSATSVSITRASAKNIQIRLRATVLDKNSRGLAVGEMAFSKLDGDWHVVEKDLRSFR
jgi:hypothetical protein